MQKATFGAGCFWQVETAFRKIKGVKDAVVGYTGGNFDNPSYQDVCTGKTGHAEAVQVTFDPKIVSYNKLLDVFWNAHDPTQLDGQGLDIGSQYRSAIFYHNNQQKKEAIESLNKEQKNKSNKVVTEITSATTFYKAEECHQQYLNKSMLTKMKDSFKRIL